MVNVFIDKVCCCCSNNNCSKQVDIIKTRNCTTYKCNEYIKDKKKIIPYQEPLKVTAEREYVTKREL